MKNESGRSMIEMLAVLAIIGVITVSALSGYSQAMMRYKTSKTVTEVITIADEVFKLYSWKRTYPTDEIDCKTFVDEGIIGEKTQSGAYVCNNPFGGKYSVKANSSNKKCLDITVEGLPEDACKQIEDEIWSGLTLCNHPACSGKSITISVE